MINQPGFAIALRDHAHADTAAVNNKLNIFWDGTNFKVRNGLASASYVRLSLVGFGVV